MQILVNNAKAFLLNDIQILFTSYTQVFGKLYTIYQQSFRQSGPEQ